jgi:hypothetical protein
MLPPQPDVNQLPAEIKNDGQRSLQLTRMLTKRNSRLLSVNHLFVHVNKPGVCLHTLAVVDS